MSTPPSRWRALRTLRARLALLLSIGILPLGIVAVMQTAAVVDDARALEERDILSRTLQAASGERAVLRRSFGAATALGVSAASIGPSAPACTQIMRDFTKGSDAYVFAGFISPDGIMRCSSTDEVVDLSALPSWLDFINDPRPVTAINPSGEVTGQSVIITTVPILDPDTGALEGAASLSLPHRMIDTLFFSGIESIGIALLDQDGTVLAASTGIENAARFEELKVQPSRIDVPASGLTFFYEDTNGQEQLAAVVPLLEDRVFVLGLWDGATQGYSVPFLGTPAPLFPILMWLVALGLGILAVDRLILRHLGRLQRKMSGFSLDDPQDSLAHLDHPPSEIAEIANAYNLMVERIVHDGAMLEDNVREKELLLREIHHRVKNNLQLIASILNIQMRTVPEGQARRILGRVQDRVLSLSKIHKALYSDTTVTSVRVDSLLGDVIAGAFSVGIPTGTGIETSQELDPVTLDPDLAVPLALLTNELVTNAVKYVGMTPQGPPFIRVSLTREDNEICLCIENSIGDAIQKTLPAESSGLGHNLIDAFVTQLGATQEKHQTANLYRVTVRFADMSDSGPQQNSEDGGNTSDGNAALAQ